MNDVVVWRKSETHQNSAPDYLCDKYWDFEFHRILRALYYRWENLRFLVAVLVPMIRAETFNENPVGFLLSSKKKAGEFNWNRHTTNA